VTFSEFVTEALAVDPADSVHVQVGYWRHGAEGAPGTQNAIQFQIWSGNRHQHFAAKTPEIALELFRSAAHPAPAGLESVGELVVASRVPCAPAGAGE
jgi:hypothetical protein